MEVPPRPAYTVPRTETRHDMLKRVEAGEGPIAVPSAGSTRALHDLINAGLIGEIVTYVITEAGKRQAKVWDVAREHEEWARSVQADQLPLPDQSELWVCWVWDAWAGEWSHYRSGTQQDMADVAKMAAEDSVGSGSVTVVFHAAPADQPPKEKGPPAPEPNSGKPSRRRMPAGAQVQEADRG